MTRSPRADSLGMLSTPNSEPPSGAFRGGSLATQSVEKQAGLDRATLLEKAAYRLSCQGAIKAGEALTAEQMEALVEEFRLRCGKSGYTCPHGRPVAVELPWESIERQVGRG